MCRNHSGFSVVVVNGLKSDFDKTIGIHPSSAEEIVTLKNKSKILDCNLVYNRKLLYENAWTPDSWEKSTSSTITWIKKLYS